MVLKATSRPPQEEPCLLDGTHCVPVLAQGFVKGVLSFLLMAFLRILKGWFKDRLRICKAFLFRESYPFLKAFERIPILISGFVKGFLSFCLRPKGFLSVVKACLRGCYPFLMPFEGIPILF